LQHGLCLIDSNQEMPILCQWNGNTACSTKWLKDAQLRFGSDQMSNLINIRFIILDLIIDLRNMRVNIVEIVLFHPTSSGRL